MELLDHFSSLAELQTRRADAKERWLEAKSALREAQKLADTSTELCQRLERELSDARHEKRQADQRVVKLKHEEQELSRMHGAADGELQAKQADYVAFLAATQANVRSSTISSAATNKSKAPGKTDAQAKKSASLEGPSQPVGQRLAAPSYATSLATSASTLAPPPTSLEQSIPPLQAPPSSSLHNSTVAPTGMEGNLLLQPHSSAKNQPSSHLLVGERSAPSALAPSQAAPDMVAAAHQRMLDTLGMGGTRGAGLTNVPLQPARVQPSSAEAAERLLQSTVQAVMKTPCSGLAGGQLLSTAGPWLEPPPSSARGKKKALEQPRKGLVTSSEPQKRLAVETKAPLSKAELKKARTNSKKLHKMMEDLSAAVAKEWHECGTAKSIVQGTDGVTEVMRRLWEWYKLDAPGLQGCVDIPDSRHLAPLHVAVMTNDPKARAVQFLLHAHANPNVEDEEGNTPLVIAGYFDNSAEAVKQLLRAGAAYNHCGSEGSTAIMTAAETLNEDVLGLLVEAGADVGIKNEAGLQAMDLARRNEDPEVMQVTKANCMALLAPTAEGDEIDDLVVQALT